MKEDEIAIQQTKSWLNTFIVKHNICPFAGREVVKNTIRYSVCDETDISLCLEMLLCESRILDVDKEVETTLLIFQKSFPHFDDYLDFVDMANQLMFDQDYEGTYQLATFHPDYCFADSEKNDPANYTNRSPYPMLHIIREASLEQALKNYPDAESIPEKNIELTRNLGLEQMQTMLQACYDVKSDDK